MVSPTNEEDVKIPSQVVKNGQHELSIEDFELLKVIGAGSYGKVLLCRKKDN